MLVIDEQKSELADIQAKGIETLTGLAGEQALLDRVNLAGARWLILAIPNAFEAGHLIMQARAANPNIRILARAHHIEEVDHLRSLGADVIVMGEDEIARCIISDILRNDGRKPDSSGTPGETSRSSGPPRAEHADDTGRR